MSSDLQSILLALQQNNYLSLALLVVVGYDYILVFSKEIEYIWNRPWTWVSTLFVFVRYCGLYNLAFSALIGSSFLPGPAKMYVLGLPSLSRLRDTVGIYRTVVSLSRRFHIPVLLTLALQGQTLNTIESWTYVLFLCAADFTMILRVWAMYNRSRAIFGILLTAFSIEIISMVVAAVIYSNPKDQQWFTIQILDYSVCVGGPIPDIWKTVTGILQMVFAAVLCMLAVGQFVKHSLQMYKVSNRWQLNRYIKLLVQQGIVYFLAIFLLNLFGLLLLVGKLSSTGWQFILACIVNSVPAITLTPRFIISIREMHDRDVQGGRAGGVDTGFGFATISGSSSVAGGPMMFATGAQSEILENVEASAYQSEGRETMVLVPV